MQIERNKPKIPSVFQTCGISKIKFCRIDLQRGRFLFLHSLGRYRNSSRRWRQSAPKQNIKTRAIAKIYFDDLASAFGDWLRFTAEWYTFELQLRGAELSGRRWRNRLIQRLDFKSLFTAESISCIIDRCFIGEGDPKPR